MSLRARLLLITLAMVALALSAAGWATHRALRDFLVDRVDRELADSRGSVLAHLNPPDQGRQRRDGGPGPPIDLPPDSVAEIRGASGGVLKSVTTGIQETTLTLPEAVPEGYSDADLPGEAGDYRLLAVEAGSAEGRLPPGALPEGATLIVGVPLSDIDDTLGRLLLIELAVGGATLAALSVLALWLVRLGLRPLERIGATADAIAAGDLSRRVDVTGATTEIGRLGRTLNAMLARIEEAFAERREAERRLRQFVADASHELQTPLTSVRGYAELFRRGAAERPADLETTSVAQGRFDMAASSATITPERAKVVDFGDPYFNATQSIMVQEGSDIASADDLEGKRLGVQRGTTGADFAAKVPGAEVSRYDLFPDAANALAAGRVDAVVNDYAVSAYAAGQSPGLVVAARVGAEEQYGLVFPKSNPALRDAFGTAFEEVKADGTFAEIYREWFGEDPPEELL